MSINYKISLDTKADLQRIYNYGYNRWVKCEQIVTLM